MLHFAFVTLSNLPLQFLNLTLFHLQVSLPSVQQVSSLNQLVLELVVLHAALTDLVGQPTLIVDLVVYLLAKSLHVLFFDFHSLFYMLQLILSHLNLFC